MALGADEADLGALVLDQRIQAHRGAVDAEIALRDDLFRALAHGPGDEGQPLLDRQGRVLRRRGRLEQADVAALISQYEIGEGASGIDTQAILCPHATPLRRALLKAETERPPPLVNSRCCASVNLLGSHRAVAQRAPSRPRRPPGCRHRRWRRRSPGARPRSRTRPFFTSQRTLSTGRSKGLPKPPPPGFMLAARSPGLMVAMMFFLITVAAVLAGDLDAAHLADPPSWTWRRPPPSPGCGGPRRR